MQMLMIPQPMLHYKAVANSRMSRTSDILLCIFGFIGMAYTSVLTISSNCEGFCQKKPIFTIPRRYFSMRKLG